VTRLLSVVGGALLAAFSAGLVLLALVPLSIVVGGPERGDPTGDPAGDRPDTWWEVAQGAAFGGAVLLVALAVAAVALALMLAGITGQRPGWTRRRPSVR